MKIHNYKLSVIRQLVNHHKYTTEKATEWVVNHPDYIVSMWESAAPSMQVASDIAGIERIAQADNRLNQENSGNTDSWMES